MMKSKSNLNLRMVIRTLGFLLFVEAIFMFLPVIVSIIYHEDDLQTNLISACITLSAATLITILTKTETREMGKREGFLVVALCWIVFSIFGVLPFYIGGWIPNYSQAFFETMSGFSTTGASILNDIESLPHGILFWRSIIQWLGGMGIIVLTLAFLPMLNTGGGIQLYNAEVPGVKHEKLTPHIASTAKRLWGMYAVITAILILLLYLGPMDLFDAICHAFTTMATGGYSTKQSSIAYWNSAYIEYVISLFMLIAGTNFTLVYFLFKGKIKKVLQDEEFKWYMGIVLLSTLVITATLLIRGIFPDVEYAFRTTLFQVASIVTTTGFVTADYSIWGSVFCMIFFLLMLPGACAGSTSGGTKTVRFVIAFKNTRNEFFRQLHPNAIVPVRLNKKVLGPEIVSRVLAFLFIYILLLFASSLILTFLGIGFEEALAATLTCISNVGPGLGQSGPAGNFSGMPDSALWLLSFNMLVGRLELFTVLLLFYPSFWKK